MREKIFVSEKHRIRKIRAKNLKMGDIMGMGEKILTENSGNNVKFTLNFYIEFRQSFLNPPETI